MVTAKRVITELLELDDVNVTLGAAVDEYALCWDNSTGKFVLRAVLLSNRPAIRYAQDFGLNAELADWMIPGAAAVVDGALVITPTLEGELLADPGVEAAYVAGLCGSLGKGGSPTLAESADVHGGARAQAFTATANGNYVWYVGPAATANCWYLGSVWVKRTAGTAGSVIVQVRHGNGAGLASRAYVGADAWTQYKCGIRAVSTNTPVVNVAQSSIAPFDSVIADDFSFQKITTATLSICRLAGGSSYRVSVTPQQGQSGVPYGVWLCVDNPANPQNGILVHYNDAQVVMDKVVAGAITNLLAVDYTGYGNTTINTIEGVRDGNDYSMFAGGTQKGATQTGITDIGSCLYVGIFCVDPVIKMGRFDVDSPTVTINVLGYGDSKTAALNGPLGKLGGGFREVPTRIAAGGTTVAVRKAAVDADLAAATGTPDYILSNLGTSDFVVASATWISDYGYILDAMHAKWPLAQIGLAIPWKTGSDAGADQRAIDLATLCATRGYASIGPDERVVIKPYADRLSSDGTHPTTLGYYHMGVAWRSWMGL